MKCLCFLGSKQAASWNGWRLTSGTTDKVPLRIRNLTPGIVNIDGGADQTAESSGGSPNTVTRSVQGLVRGDFKIEWSLATDRCPCS